MRRNETTIISSIVARWGWLLFFICPFLTQRAFADRPAVHGMLLFGSSPLYLSHLPMFHSPHDYQAIFEVTLPASASQQYLADAAATAKSDPSGYYTLVPEPFVLPAMIAHPHPFKATVYRGHFERGGVPILNEVIVTPTKLVYAAKLAAETAAPPRLQYLLFGAPGSLYAAHRISGAPGFDQLVQVQLEHAIPPSTGEIAITFPNLPDSEEVHEGDRLDIALPSSAKGVLDVQHVIYTEHDDLAG